MKIASIIILYHPDQDLLSKNIAAVYNSVDVIYLWRNSEVEFELPLEFNGKCVFCGREENDYIAKPINEVLSICNKKGFDYLLTMDQDSVYADIAKTVEYVASQSYDNGVAIYAPNVNGTVTSGGETYQAETVITSGSIMNVEVALKLGGLREDYGIYWVDGEYCCWARQNGYRIEVLTGCHMEQQFGKQTKGLFNCTAYNYSPSTYYFMFRNMLWMHREYPKGVSVKCILYTSKMYIMGIIFGHEKNAFKKLGRICRAFSDGFFRKIEKRIAIPN